MTLIAKQIPQDEAAGKTVKGVFLEEQRCIVTFTDATFIQIEIEQCPEVSPWLEIRTGQHPDSFCNQFDVDAGIYDRDAFEKRDKAWREMMSRSQERREREAYEALKQKFGDN